MASPSQVLALMARIAALERENAVLVLRNAKLEARNAAPVDRRASARGKTHTMVLEIIEIKPGSVIPTSITTFRGVAVTINTEDASPPTRMDVRFQLPYNVAIAEAFNVRNGILYHLQHKNGIYTRVARGRE